jgi:methylenetetrahydrofolate dehydrogenase (NADP+) / methenyltetrahydrofolate cyclohydrolase
MAATMMDGRALAERIRSEVAAEVRTLAADGGVGLATVLVGEDAASDIYIRRKHEAAEQAGFRAHDLRLPTTISESELLDHVAALNADDAVDALLVQLPLPAHVDEDRVIRSIDPVKDVDGFHPENAGELYLGRPRLVPATAVGVLALLDEYDVELDGARAVVVGRSPIVGRPVAQLLVRRNATVTVCHTHTRDLGRETREADVLVVAAGRPAVVTQEMVKPGAAVVDVGINRTPSGLVGDVAPGAAEVAGLVTPVPGGVGPMTIACLLQNTLLCARFRRGGALLPAP